MSEDQSRGRRRPSRELTSPTEARCRPHEPDISEEPSTKIIKQEIVDETSEGPSTSGTQICTKERTPIPAAHGNNRRYVHEIVQTRPADIHSKKGFSGVKIPLQTNYFRLLTKPTWCLFQYSVDFKPELELLRLRCGLLAAHRGSFGGYIYNGSKLFTNTKLDVDKTILYSTTKNDQKYVITLQFIGVVSMDDKQSLHILNMILRRSMHGLKLQQVGRNLFDPFAKIDVRGYRLELWPGYQTSIRKHEQDLLLCAELIHKVMRTETVYDILKQCRQTGRDIEDDFRRQVLGMIVLTDYNNKTYRIDDIDFEHNPLQTFKLKGEEISFMDYYKKKYHLHIKDPRQPLLISNVKESAMRSAGSNELIILIPELCRATGLNMQMRNNFQLMRAMADSTRLNPDRRIERLLIFNRRLQKTDESVKVLKDWNMTLDTKLVELEGRQLDPQRIVFSNNSKVSTGDYADWTRYFRDNGLFTTPSRGLERWGVIALSRNSRELRGFVDALIRAGESMRMHISRPHELLIHDDRNHSYLQAMEECCRSDPQLILCLVPNNNQERYSSIKKKGCLERAIPTQVITQKTATNQRSLMSIATKVVIQINCKLGYTPWMIDLPLSGLMTIGYDIAKNTRDRSKAFGAMVASMDLKFNSTFYSTVAECSPHDVLANSLWPMMAKALRQYRREHDNNLPTRILFYRDGVGEGSLAGVFEHEIKDILENLKQEYKRANVDKPPMIAYIIVSKSINTRLMASGRNPPPGTVVDDIITMPERYDFYLVSQCVRQGSVAPTSYNVIYSNIKLTPDQIQLLTYKMTHLYFNWSGTTRVPAVCQYAKKLATLVATNLYQPPPNILEKKLYYL